MVTICQHNERFSHLLNAQDSSDIQEHIVCGGQPASFHRRHLVDLQTALTAATHYLATAHAAPALSRECYS